MTFDSGTLLNNGTYKIVNSHFEGGFGITYKATHIRLNKTVLIKVPNIRKRNGLDYKYNIEVFEREGSILSKIPRDSNIVIIHDFFDETVKIEGFSGKVPCLVMEFIEGETLWSVVNNQDKLSEAAAIKYIKQIASALALCHKHGIVHRDVKPENIILRENSDDVVLIDFGLAGNQGTEYNAGRTQDFAPWEQIASLTDFPTSEYREIVQKFKSQPTVDIYSLSATLYYLVTLEPPVNSWTRYEKHQNDPLVSPKIKNPELSEEINTAILKGLNTDPKKRPQTIEEWLKYLPEPQVNISTNRTEPDIPTKHEPVLPREKPKPKVISKTEPNGFIRFHDFDSLIEPEKTINGDYIIHECCRAFDNIRWSEIYNTWVSGGYSFERICNYTTDEYPRYILKYVGNFTFNDNYPPEDNQPAIIAAIIKNDDQLFSVVSVATRALDDGGRPTIAYRYFFCRGNMLEAVLAWIEKFRTEHGNYPVCNLSPEHIVRVGDFHTISKQEVKRFCQNLPSIREDILQQHSPIILSSEQYSIQEIHTIARLKSRGKEAMAWFFNGKRFLGRELCTVTHYADEELAGKHAESIRREEERLKQQENKEVPLSAAYIPRPFINNKNNNQNKQDKLDLSIFFGEEIAVLAKEELAKKAARIRLIIMFIVFLLM